jgi:hypothetical protein
LFNDLDGNNRHHKTAWLAFGLAATTDLTETDCAALAALLRDTIAAHRFPLSPRIRGLRAILR